MICRSMAPWPTMCDMRRLREDQATVHLSMMLALTFATGIIDAVGYLGLDRVFTANMTGNVVILAMAITGANGLPVIGPLVALFAFLGGAAIGGRVLRTSAPGWQATSTMAFATTGALVAALGIASLVVTPVKDTTWAFVITGLLGAAMGLQAAGARKLAVADVTTVVVTSTIVGLASDSRFAGGSSKNWVRRTLAVVLLLAGAATGALLLRVHIGAGMLLAGVLVLLVSALGHRLRAVQPASTS